MILSPQAQKAQFEASARWIDYAPSLYRTKTKAIIMRPACGGHHFQAKFFWFVHDRLPAFTFNSEKRWWEAPLDQLLSAHNTLSEAYHVYLSDGARAYLDQHTPEPERVVLEYNWSYSSPLTSGDAIGLEYSVVAGDNHLGKDLYEARSELGRRGYARSGACVVEFHQNGRYNPKWREVYERG